MHQLKLVHYVNDRGGYAFLKPLDPPPSEFQGLRSVFEKIMEHEIYITHSINELYQLCLEERDHTTGNFLLAMGRSKMSMILAEDGKPFYGEGYQFVYGKADQLRNGNAAAIIAMGGMVSRALKAQEKLKAQGVEVMVLSMACPTDPDIEAIRKAAATGLIVTLEDHNVRTGLGSIVANVIAEQSLPCKLVKLGVQRYGSSGVPDELYASQGLDPDNVVKTILREKK